MVSTAHEAMHRIFREDPHLFARVLPRAGIPFPEATSIEPLDTDLTRSGPWSAGWTACSGCIRRARRAGSCSPSRRRADRTRTSQAAGRTTWRTCTPSTGCHPSCWSCAGTRRPRHGPPSPSASAVASTRAWWCSRWSSDPATCPRSPTRGGGRRPRPRRPLRTRPRQGPGPSCDTGRTGGGAVRRREGTGLQLGGIHRNRSGRRPGKDVVEGTLVDVHASLPR